MGVLTQRAVAAHRAEAYLLREPPDGAEEARPAAAHGDFEDGADRIGTALVGRCGAMLSPLLVFASGTALPVRVLIVRDGWDRVWGALAVLLVGASIGWLPYWALRAAREATVTHVFHPGGCLASPTTAWGAPCTPAAC